MLYDVGPAWAGSVAAAQRRLRAPLAVGVNLALNDPANAVALVGALRRAGLAPPGLAALEVGNEPELYARGRAFRVGRVRVVRPRQRVTYSPQQYALEARRYIDALEQRDPAPLAVGGYVSEAWAKTALSSLGGDVDELLAHAYALAACNPSTDPAGLRARLLTDAASRGIVRYLEPYAGRGLPIRVSEFNSAICGGVAGVSDTFAAALWAPDALFALAQAGARQVDLHTWAGAYDAPFVFDATRGAPVATVRPLYYGLLLFARAAPAGSRLLPVRVADPRSGVRAWATKDPDGGVRVLLVNRGAQDARDVRLTLGGPSRTRRLQRLEAPGPSASNGATLAGQRVAPRTTSGQLRGRLATTAVTIDGGAATITLPGASAALLLDT